MEVNSAALAESDYSEFQGQQRNKDLHRDPLASLLNHLVTIPYKNNPDILKSEFFFMQKNTRKYTDLLADNKPPENNFFLKEKYIPKISNVKPITSGDIETITSINLNNFTQNRDIRRIQQFLEQIVYENVVPLENYGILQETRRFAREYDFDYFKQQAELMAGMPDPVLAFALLEFQQDSGNLKFGEYLRAFLKKGAELSDEELRRYAIRQDIRQESSFYGRFFSDKYFDTTFNFCLTYDGQLIASAGFDAAQGRMFIRQIQGVRGEREKLRPIKWERALVSYAVEWAQNHGINEVAVASVDNNKWTRSKYCCLSAEQGKMLYDVTARRTGFKQRDEHGNYVRKLKTHASPLPERVS